MNVIHALAWYFPESTGGTEVYVAGLAKELAALGVVNAIVAPGTQSADYVHDSVPVHRYPFGAAPELAAVRGERAPRQFEDFVAWLDRQPRGIYHQHSWTTSCGAHHLAAAKSLGFKAVLTVHVPSNICLRGTLLEYGTDPCDGRVEAVRCAACWSQGRGLPRIAARALSRIPQCVSRAAYSANAEQRMLTALGARELAAARRRDIAAMGERADRVVAVCAWLEEALRDNGIAAAKLSLSRQGVDRSFGKPVKRRRDSASRFRLGFLGRSDAVKGLHVLIEAVAILPGDLPFELHIHAVANTEDDRRRLDSLVAKTVRDPRVVFQPPVGREQIPDILASFDMLAVPSQWKETGPLVVLEAQACGVPVLGSELGGIAELVTPGVDGHLVAFSDPAAWAEAIRAAVAGALPCQREDRPARQVRTMADAARDMVALYASIT